MTATLSELSLGFKRTGVQVFVPKHDLASLMYYLECVTSSIGLNILDDELTDYKNYGQLSNECRDLVFEHAREFCPEELIDKVIFRDDQKIITNRLMNEFVEISVACGVVSVQKDILIAGKMQSITKVMFYQQRWLEKHYYRPMKRALAQRRHINPYLKGITLYIAPLFYVTALFLSIFVFLSPAAIFLDQVALLTITATASAQPGPTDGLRLFLGALGSCAKKNSTAQVQCTKPLLHPAYDLSILPSSAPKLSIPSIVLNTPPFITFSFGSAFLFFLLYNLTAYRYKIGKWGLSYDSRSMQKFIAWLGFLGIIMGLGCFVSLRRALGTTVQDFNAAIEDPNYEGPQLVASIASGFIMAYIAYGFYGVAVFVHLYKLAIHAERCFWST
jgi:hypothetical protein